MKKKDYFGKYILREGDLRPEEINKQSCEHYKFTINELAYFESIGLLFDNKEEALMHWKCIMGAMKKPVDKRDFDNLVPVWRFAFVMNSESGIGPDKDKYLLEEEQGILVKVQKGSHVAWCLLLKELDKLPKEKGL